jgi:hypothetical protein
MRKLMTGAVCGALAFLGLLVAAAPYVADAMAQGTEFAQKGSKSDGKEGSGLTRASLGF